MVVGLNGVRGVLVQQLVVLERKFVQEIATIPLQVMVVLIVKEIIARVQFVLSNLVLV